MNHPNSSLSLWERVAKGRMRVRRTAVHASRINPKTRGLVASSSLSLWERVAEGRVRVRRTEIHASGINPEALWSVRGIQGVGPRRGAALVVALVTMLVVAMIAGALVQSLLANHRQQIRQQHQLQAEWLATSGILRARAQLARQADYTGETWQAPIHETAEEAAVDPPGVDAGLTGQVTIKIEDNQILVEAIYPLDDLHRALVRREAPGDSP